MFVQAIQFLIKENILNVPPTTQGSAGGNNEIPSWIKNNAGSNIDLSYCRDKYQS